MLALSVHAPWWFAILYMGKDIENRPWPTPFHGRILLHATKWWDEDQVQNDLGDAMFIMESRGLRLDSDSGIDLAAMRASGGSIVGSVDLNGCVEHSRSPWFFGKYGLCLANPEPLAQPVPCPGSRKLFPVPEHIACQAVEQLIEYAGR